MTEPSDAWFERFPGHFFLNHDGSCLAHVCCRGPNLWHPIAIIDQTTPHKCLFYEECGTVEEAQLKCEEWLAANG